jgi:hypothetical protein
LRECPFEVKSVRPLAQRRNHHIDSVIDCKRISAPVERPFADGIEQIIMAREREVECWRRYPEVRFQVWYGLTINRNGEIGCGIYGILSSLAHTVDGRIRLFGYARWSLAGRAALFQTRVLGIHNREEQRLESLASIYRAAARGAARRATGGI